MDNHEKSKQHLQKLGIEGKGAKSEPSQGKARKQQKKKAELKEDYGYEDFLQE